MGRYQMIEYLQLAVGVFYLMWTKFRVTILRQKLFEIRDELWEKALKLDSLDDPAYLKIRSRFNSMIRSAHAISVPTLTVAMVQMSDQQQEYITSDNPKMQQHLEEAISDATLHILRYIVFCRPFSGWLLIHLIGTTLSINENVKMWLGGNRPIFLDSASLQH